MKLHSVLSDFCCCNRTSENRSFIRRSIYFGSQLSKVKSKMRHLFSLRWELLASRLRGERASGCVWGRQGGAQRQAYFIIILSRDLTQPRERKAWIAVHSSPPTQLPNFNRNFGANKTTSQSWNKGILFTYQKNPLPEPSGKGESFAFNCNYNRKVWPLKERAFHPIAACRTHLHYKGHEWCESPLATVRLIKQAETRSTLFPDSCGTLG